MNSVSLHQKPLTARIVKRKGAEFSYDWWAKHADGSMTISKVTSTSAEAALEEVKKLQIKLMYKGYDVTVKGYGRL